jgi:hypothetical protein
MSCIKIPPCSQCKQEWHIGSINYPCGHMTFCAACAPKEENRLVPCPICKKPVNVYRITLHFTMKQMN